MKKIFLILSVFLSLKGLSQAPSIIPLKADSIIMYKTGGGYAEFVLRNLTKDTKGFLINKGNGITEFQRGLITLNDSTFIIGVDTLHIHAGSGGGGTGNTNSNIGSGFRLAVPSTNNIKTLFNGYAVGIDSSSNTNGLTLKADTSLLQTKLLTNKLRDSLIALIPSGGYTTTAMVAGTTTLTSASTQLQYFTGSSSSGQTVLLPVASTLVLGKQFTVVNNNTSTGIVTVQSSGGNTVATMIATQSVAVSSSIAVFTCILTSGTNASSWSVSYFPASSYLNLGGSIALRDGSGGLTAADLYAGTATIDQIATIGTASSANGDLKFKNSASAFTQTFRGSDPGANITYVLPTTAPTAGQILSSTAPSAGIATMSWTTPSVTGDSAIWKNNGTYTGNRILTMGGFSQTFTGGKISVLSGALADQSNALLVTSTLPSGSVSNTNSTVSVQATPQNSSFPSYAVSADLLAGATDNSFRAAAVFGNHSSGTGSTPFSNVVAKYNSGIYSYTDASTVGDNVGVTGNAWNGAYNFGVYGKAVVSNAGNNIGVVGIAQNAVGVRVGIYAGFDTIKHTFTDAALMADNSYIAANIFTARDNGSNVFEIQDGGGIKLNSYIGSNFYGTLSRRLGVDASGNVIQDTTSSGGGGSVTSFSAGTLSPLFTTSVATSTTTPALSFALTNTSAYTLFGRGASTGAPSYLASIDSNWIPSLHTEAYYNTKYGSTGWGLLGNAGTNSATNFIGTTDNVGLSFRSNNIIKAAIGTTTLYDLGLGNNLTTVGATTTSENNVLVADTSTLVNGSVRVGYLAVKTGYGTGAANTGSLWSGYFETRVGASSTANLTNTQYGIIGATASTNTQPGSTGTISRAVSFDGVCDYSGMTIFNSYRFFARDAFAHGTAVVTNNYGIYIEKQSAGGTNYNFYSAGPNNVIAAGVLVNQIPALKVTATMPTTITGPNFAIDNQITSAGSSGTVNGGLNVSYLPGYTGSFTTSAITVANTALGTGSGIINTNNRGFSSTVSGTTTGTNVGALAVASNGNMNAGLAAWAVTAKNSATNIGVVGIGLNSGTSPIQIGGYFGLHSADPTFTSAALIADNGSTTSPILVLRDNGTVVSTMSDGGNLFIGGTTATATAKLHLGAGTTAASTAPFKFTTGTNLTTAEAGAMEYTDPLLYFTPTGTVRGVVMVSKSSRATAQTAANASVFTYTLPATDGSFKVSANVLVTTSSAENFSLTCSYTDEGNTARTQTVPFILLAGTVAGSIAFANGAVPYEGVVFRIRCKASTAITIATTGTFTGAVYNCEAGITQVN